MTNFQIMVTFFSRVAYLSKPLQEMKIWINKQLAFDDPAKWGRFVVCTQRYVLIEKQSSLLSETPSWTSFRPFNKGKIDASLLKKGYLVPTYQLLFHYGQMRPLIRTCSSYTGLPLWCGYKHMLQLNPPPDWHNPANWQDINEGVMRKEAMMLTTTSSSFSFLHPFSSCL